ncbi:unnamed protein product [Paramecium primaurelia]|uniref:Uncharacterized protein n=1 Tax=Paramecium primaurelia TaxID=5886 RepID=A0A8S1QQB9_PARPR|nr:unnamed protein product [Paramecium primaurelia]
MNLFKDQTQYTITQIQINPNILQNGKFEQLGILWDYYWNRYFQVKFYIAQTKNKKIKYSTNDEFILRVDSLEHFTQILNNLEQIKYLFWFEISKPNLNQLGRWAVNWKGKVLQDIGGWYSNGLKQGFWKEPIQNYWTLSQAYQVGEYQDGQRIGTWKYEYEDKEIGGGKYDDKYLKNGRWIELSDNFSNNSYITYSGEYKNNKKIDKWDINYRFSSVYPFEQIGGGSYNIQGIKDGKWIDLIDNFYRQKQVTFNGEYQNYQKVGRWDTYFRIEGLFQSEFQLMQIKLLFIFKFSGGGSYENGGIKNGIWIELSDNFYKILKWKKNKVMSYQIQIKRLIRINVLNQLFFNLIFSGGGYYDVKGIKQGYWIELSDDFRYINKEEKQIDGISFLGSLINLNKCDFYNELGFKIGSWVEINECFSNLGQVLYQGEYFFGKKTGKWNIYWKNNINLEKLGGGLYDDNGLKKRIWMELANDFNQSLIQGEYKCGQTVGVWDTYFRFSKRFEEMQISIVYSFIFRSCGFQDQERIENGIWIELDEDFKMNQNCQNEQQQQFQINHSLGTIQRREKDWKMERIKERKMEY